MDRGRNAILGRRRVRVTEEGASSTPGRCPVLGLAAGQELELIHQFVFSTEMPRGHFQQKVIFSREGSGVDLSASQKYVC